MQRLYQMLYIRNYIGDINIFIIHSLLFLSGSITCPQMLRKVEVNLFFHEGEEKYTLQFLT